MSGHGRFYSHMDIISMKSLIMPKKKKQAVESGSLYMTLDAFYRPVYLSMRGQGEEGFSRYISNNVRSHTTGREFIPDH